MEPLIIESVKPHLEGESGEYVVELSNGERFITTAENLHQSYEQFRQMEYKAFMVMFATVWSETNR